MNWRDVAYWHLADISAPPRDVHLSGVKQTSELAGRSQLMTHLCLRGASHVAVAKPVSGSIKAFV